MLLKFAYIFAVVLMLIAFPLFIYQIDWIYPWHGFDPGIYGGSRIDSYEALAETETSRNVLYYAVVIVTAVPLIFSLAILFLRLNVNRVLAGIVAVVSQGLLIYYSAAAMFPGRVL